MFDYSTQLHKANNISKPEKQKERPSDPGVTWLVAVPLGSMSPVPVPEVVVVVVAVVAVVVVLLVLVCVETSSVEPNT